MPTWSMFIVFAALIACGIILIHGSFAGRDLPDGAKAAGRWVTGISVAGLAAFGVVLCLCLSHGLYTLSIPVTRLVPAYQASPADQSGELKSVDDAKGKVIIVYRFGCPDCEDSFEATKAAVEGKDVLWVSSRSEIGHELCQDYGVEWVPSVLSVSKDNNVVIRDLYANDLSGLDEAFENVGA